MLTMFVKRSILDNWQGAKYCFSEPCFDVFLLFEQMFNNWKDMKLFLSAVMEIINITFHLAS